MKNNLMGHRITKVRGHLSKAAFAKELLVEPPYISMLESGKSFPGKRLIELICLKFNVNETWLLTGEGEMYKSAAAETEEGPQYVGRIDDISKKILLLLKDMSEEDRLATLRKLEEKKFLREMLEERKGLKDAG